MERFCPSLARGPGLRDRHTGSGWGGWAAGPRRPWPGCRHAMVHQRSMARLPARLAAPLWCMGSPTSPGAPGGLSHTAAAATFPSTGRTGRQPAQGRAHGGRKHTGRLRAPRSGSGKCGPRPCQLDRQPQCCRTGQPATASEQAALNTAHERGLQGPDRVRETTVVVVGVFPVRVPPQKRASTVPNAGADPWSWIAASVATRDPSDGSGPDRSCLDDG